MDMDRSSLLLRLSMHILQVTKSWVGLGNEARTAVDLVSRSQTGETTGNIQLPLIVGQIHNHWKFYVPLCLIFA